jgi:hypothetical protein
MLKQVIAIGASGSDSFSSDPSVMIPVSLFGEDGNDVLQGGGGTTLLVGGNGNDTYVIPPGFGNTAIRKVGTGSDTLDLSHIGASLDVELGGNQVPADGSPILEFDTDKIQRLILGSGDDQVSFVGTTTLGGGSGQIIGGSNGLTLDYSQFTQPASVNLPPNSNVATATGTGGVTNPTLVFPGPAGGQFIGIRVTTAPPPDTSRVAFGTTSAPQTAELDQLLAEFKLT